MENIVLIGFMGTGKSSIGRLLAERMGMRFLDTDDLIEREAGIPVKEIFKRFGEERFRELERKVIGMVASGRFGDGIVLSTGGGAVVDISNRETLKGWGTLVCLKASVDTILERIGDGDERPLLSRGDKKRIVAELLRKREPAYNEADLIVDTSSKDMEEIVGIIEDFVTRRSFYDRKE